MSSSQGQPADKDTEKGIRATALIRVLIVDDQLLIRRGLTAIFDTEADIEVVGDAADGEAALERCRALRPDVVLMDLIMPRLGGIAATRALTAECPGTQVVVLTTFDADNMVFDAIRAGAQAYLLKDASEAEVLDTIRAVHRGESRLAPHIARKVLGEFRRLPAVAEPVSIRQDRESGSGKATSAAAQGQAGQAGQRGAAQQADRLTQREEDILELIAQGKSNKEIANVVNLAEGTVKNYVSRIMDKLHARTRTELAVRAISERKI
jgi:DNA-binding NarL/FixJ family response regulator